MSKDFNFSDDGECIFAVVMVTYDIISDSMGIEPVGMYSSLKKALKYAAELEVYAKTSVRRRRRAEYNKANEKWSIRPANWRRRKLLLRTNRQGQTKDRRYESP